MSMKVIILRVINFQYFRPRETDVVGREAADSVSDRHVRRQKLGNGMIR